MIFLGNPLHPAASGLLCALMFFQVSCGPSRPQEDGVYPPRTADILTHMSESISRSLIVDAGIATIDTCTAYFENSQPTQHFIEDSFLATLRSACATLIVTREALPRKTRIEIQQTNTQVRYDWVAGGGVFGNRSVARIVALDISARVISGEDSHVVYAGNIRRDYRDTLDVEDVENIESVAIPATHAEIPAAGFFDRIVEPIVIIVTGGILLYLLFTVRS